MEVFVYSVGAGITFLGSLYAIKRGWWSRSGATEEDGENLEWSAGGQDAMFVALVWPLVLPLILIFGVISLVITWGEDRFGLRDWRE